MVVSAGCDITGPVTTTTSFSGCAPTVDQWMSSASRDARDLVSSYIAAGPTALLALAVVWWAIEQALRRRKRGWNDEA